MQDMEKMIRRSHSRMESLHTQLMRGDYDILSPTGEIILPDVWSEVVQPGWVIQLRFLSDSEPTQKAEHQSHTRSEISSPTHPPPPMVEQSRPIAIHRKKSTTGQLSLRRYSVGSWLAKRQASPNSKI